MQPPHYSVTLQHSLPVRIHEELPAVVEGDFLAAILAGPRVHEGNLEEQRLHLRRIHQHDEGKIRGFFQLQKQNKNVVIPPIGKTKETFP